MLHSLTFIITGAHANDGFVTAPQYTCLTADSNGLIYNRSG